MMTFRQDIGYATRLLRRKPAFTALAVATMGLGIGAATTIFTIVDGVLLTPLGFHSPNQLVTVWQTDGRFQQQPTQSRRWNRLWFTYPEYQAWSHGQRSFAAVAVFGSQEMALTEPGQPAEVTVYTATPTLLPLLGVRPALGRWFLPDEQGTGAERLAVLSHQMWTATFGGDTTALNRFVTLDDERFRIIGVMPRDFRLPNLTSSITAPPAVWIPLGADGGGGSFDSSYEGIGRLLPGVTLDAATTETSRLIATAAGRDDRGARLVPRFEAETATARAPLLLLGAGVVLLLTIACVNMTTLLLGEAPAREHEFATRKALGASRGRMVRQLLTESLILATFAGVVGAGLSFAGVRLLLAWAPESMPRVDEIGVDLRVLCFALALTTLTGLGVGLAPALSASHDRVGETLRLAARQVNRRRRRAQQFAIVAQVALALVLLSSASMLARNLFTLNAIDPGFDADGVLTLSVTPSATRHDSPAALRAFHDQLAIRLAALPGVEVVGAISNLPFGGRNGTMSIEVPGLALSADSSRPNVQRRSVRPGYFPAMGIPFLQGRNFSAADAQNVIVIDEAMAQRFWPGESALGRQIRAYNQPMTIIGVTAAVRHTRLHDAPQPTVYFPYTTMGAREMMVVVRVAGDPMRLAMPVREAVRSLDATIPLTEVVPLATVLARATAVERYQTVLLGFFGLAATLLTAIGILGVTARMVNQRRQEIGVRVALGATRWSIARMVLGRQVLSVTIGLAIGAVLVRLAVPLLSRFLYESGSFDFVAVLLAGAFLGAAGIVGGWVPTRAASRVHPAGLLRDEA